MSQMFDVTYRCRALLDEVYPHIYHSCYDLRGFPFADRLDMYAVIEPGERALLVDTGWDLLCGTEHIDAIVRDFDVPFENLEVFVTHHHLDHEANLPYLLRNGVKRVYLPQRFECDVMEVAQAHLRQVGPYRELTRGLINVVDNLTGGIDLSEFEGYDTIRMGKDDVIEIGGYCFKAMETPGHTLNHQCLVDPVAGVMFAGDHILEVAPIVNQLDHNWHLLTRCINSLTVIREMELNAIYLSHADAVEDAAACFRVVENMIIGNDEAVIKTEDALRALDRPACAFEVLQKYFENRPTGFMGSSPDSRTTKLARRVGHLEYLVDLGRVEKTITNEGLVLYRSKLLAAK